MAPIAANATSTAALWPGTLASTFAYRRELAEELAVFRSETNHTLMAIVWLFAVLGLLAVLFGLAHFFW